MRTPLTIARFICLVAISLIASEAGAVPGISGARVTDVTPSSFSIVWGSDTPGQIGAEVYADPERKVSLGSKVEITAMPASALSVASAAASKGAMKIRVSGLDSSTLYYARVYVKELSSPFATGYSQLLSVRTAQRTMPYKSGQGGLSVLDNNLASFRVYVRPADGPAESSIGEIVLLETEGCTYPVSAFVGDGTGAPVAVLDLNNLYGADGISYDVAGGEGFVITVYRKNTLSRLVHYRRAPMEEGSIKVLPAEAGFFADINLDGNVDDADFGLFRLQYRGVANDVSYNPDFDFVADDGLVVDVREFSMFSREFGRTNVK